MNNARSWAFSMGCRMPNEFSGLPTKCELWLELAFRMISEANKYDSGSPEFGAFYHRAQECLDHAMREVKELNEAPNDK